MVPIGSHASGFQGAGDSKARLLEAAVLLFARHGYEDAAIRSIAVAAGCNSAMIAFHFKGKRPLYRAAAERAFAFVRGLAAAFPALPGAGEPEAEGRAEAALQAAAAGIQGAALGGAAGQGVDQALVRLFLRELEHPDPERHGPAQEALQPHLDYLAGALRLARPCWEEAGVQRQVAVLVGEALFCLTYPHAWAALTPPPPEPGAGGSSLQDLWARSLSGPVAGNRSRMDVPRPGAL